MEKVGPSKGKIEETSGELAGQGVSQARQLRKGPFRKSGELNAVFVPGQNKKKETKRSQTGGELKTDRLRGVSSA